MNLKTKKIMVGAFACTAMILGVSANATKGTLSVNAVDFPNCTLVDINHANQTISNDYQAYGFTTNGVSVKNPHIEIAERTGELLLRLVDFNAVGADYNHISAVPFIEYTGTSKFKLLIYYEGTNTFTYQSDCKRIDSKAIPAFNLGRANVTFISRHKGSMTIYGADGEDGINGVDGRMGKIGIESTGYDGGNGGRGTDGKNGTNGQRGCSAVKCNSIAFLNPYNLKLYGGNGGNGGNGGKGGNGGRGGQPGKHKGNVGNGGNGGNGGKGGDAAYMGLPFEVNTLSNLDIPTTTEGFELVPGTRGTPGKGGEGGEGGRGMKGSDPTYFLWWVTAEYSDGVDGQKGKKGEDGSRAIDSYRYEMYKDIFNIAW
ncbi:MAG: hypothetical protein J6T15_00110 [Bacilli bacterium]|nr:hypothetical protein [Bacilli bacterium]